MEATRLCLDMMNCLPAPIIESILCLLPIKEAARTSILCKDWRYRWTKITKLVFIEEDAPKVSDDDEQAKRKLFLYVINQVMLMHEGPIHEFFLSMRVSGRCVEIDHIIDQLSRNNGVKTLALDMMYGRYCLPESFFSLHKLTDLYLRHCHIDAQPTTFNGFSSLSNLYMEGVITTKTMLLHFLSHCPSLKTVSLHASLGPMTATANSTIVELFGCLPLIENLSISFSTMKYFFQGRVPKKLPAALVHLKCLCIKDTLDVYKDRIPCISFMIRSSPNLEKLNLKIAFDLRVETTWEDYSDMWLEHLSELEIEICRNNSRFSLEFVRLIMAKSPVLRKLKILVLNKVSSDQSLIISRFFARSRCASQLVNITVDTRSKIKRKPFNRI